MVYLFSMASRPFDTGRPMGSAGGRLNTQTDRTAPGADVPARALTQRSGPVPSKMRLIGNSLSLYWQAGHVSRGPLAGRTEIPQSSWSGLFLVGVSDVMCHLGQRQTHEIHSLCLSLNAVCSNKPTACVCFINRTQRDSIKGTRMSNIIK